MRSPWPDHGHVNRNYGHLGEKGYGRSGPPFTGPINHNYYTNSNATKWITFSWTGGRSLLFNHARGLHRFPAAGI